MPDPHHHPPKGQQRPPNAPEPAKLDEAPPPPRPKFWPGYDAGAQLVELEAPTSTNRQVALNAAVELKAADIHENDDVYDWTAYVNGMLQTADQILAWLEAGSDG